MAKVLAQATGRRKSAVARVRFYDGTGEVRLNGKPLADYFPQPAQQNRATEAVRVAQLEDILASSAVGMPADGIGGGSIGCLRN